MNEHQKSQFSVADLDRVVKFVDGLNKLADTYGIGLTSYEDIHLVLDGTELPFFLHSPDPNGLSVGVSL